MKLIIIIIILTINFLLTSCDKFKGVDSPKTLYERAVKTGKEIADMRVKVSVEKNNKKETFNEEFIIKYNSAGPFVINDFIPVSNSRYTITKEVQLEDVTEMGTMEVLKYLVSIGNVRLLYLYPNNENLPVQQQIISSIEIISNRYRILKYVESTEHYKINYISIGTTIKDLISIFPDAEFYLAVEGAGYFARIPGYNLHLGFNNEAINFDVDEISDQSTDLYNLTYKSFKPNGKIASITIY